MRKPKNRPIPHIEVADPDLAFKKLEAFGRRIMATPKSSAGLSKKTVRKKAGGKS